MKDIRDRIPCDDCILFPRCLSKYSDYHDMKVKKMIEYMANSNGRFTVPDQSVSLFYHFKLKSSCSIIAKYMTSKHYDNQISRLTWKFTHPKE